MSTGYTVFAKAPASGHVTFQESGVDESGDTPVDVLIESARRYAVTSGRLSELDADNAFWTLELKNDDAAWSPPV